MTGARSRWWPLLAASLFVGAGACGERGCAEGGPTAAGESRPQGSTRGGEASNDGWEGPAALSRARREGRPALVYVSSEWCPPCRALEESLLSRQAFRDATRGLVHVRIDGDSEGAQALISRLEAWAYPTLLLLSPAGEELFRAHHAVTLEELTPALAAATASGRGFEEAARRLREGEAPAAADCALFAAADWRSTGGAAAKVDERLAALKLAYEKCATATPGARAAIAAHLLGMAAMADQAADSALPGAPVKPMAAALLDAVLASEETAWAARTLITTWVKVVVPWVVGDDRGPRFEELSARWLRAASWVRTREGAPADVALLTHETALDLHALARPGEPVPAELAAEIEAAVKKADGLARSAGERHAVVANAAYLLRAIGERERAREMMLAEIARTDAPSHLQTTLSQWALADGQMDEARRLARAAVESARGRPSRIQWMVNELSLYSQNPADRPRLIELASATYALLFAEADAFQGRNRARAAQLASTLAPVRGDEGVRALVARHSPRCASLPEETRRDCESHFEELRDTGGVPP